MSSKFLRMRHALIFLFLLLEAPSILAQETMTQEVSYEYLDKLIAVSKANYPKIKMYEDRVRAAESGIKRARLSYFDIFSASYLFNPSNNNGAATGNPYFSGYQFGFFANVGSLLQKPSLIKQAKAELSSMQHDKEAFDLNTEAEVRKRYFTLVQKQVSLRLRTNALLDIESLLASIKHRFEKGEETLENYNRILVMQSDHSQNIINAEAELLIAKASLEELVGQKLETIK